MINKSIPNFAYLSDYEWIALKNSDDSQELLICSTTLISMLFGIIVIPRKFLYLPFKYLILWYGKGRSGFLLLHRPISFRQDKFSFIFLIRAT